MFDAERLLGSLVTSALSQGFTGRGSARGLTGGLKSAAGSLISQNKAAIGMGLLGLAVGAFEHFTQKNPPGTVVPAGGTAPGGYTPVAPKPQAPHPAVNWTPPPLPRPAAQRAEASNPDAILLVRAMIAAANADHAIDIQERQRILERVTASGLEAEEVAFVEGELANPLELRSLAEQATSPEVAEQVYAASVLAIEVDSEAERNYLQRLATALKLDASVTEKWKSQLA